MEFFEQFALAARKRFAFDNDDALRLIHAYTRALRIVPHHLRAHMRDVAPPYAIVAEGGASAAAEGRISMRVGLDVVLEQPACVRYVEYRHSASEWMAVRRCRDSTLVTTDDAVEVLFHGEVHYRFFLGDVPKNKTLCFIDPWLSSPSALLSIMITCHTS